MINWGQQKVTILITYKSLIMLTSNQKFYTAAIVLDICTFQNVHCTSLYVHMLTSINVYLHSK